ncbi:MAG TPA: creatininase family protein [Bryobacteraceae bacterium]|nr:creatininase family protein [Bryobacteraceae bacterium]
MFLGDMTWPAVKALNKDMPVVIPIAAVEQHGHHMPVYTDSMLLGEVVRRVEQAAGSTVLFAPLQWLGNSHHHMDYPGTMSASPRLYLDLLRDLAENFLVHGFKRLLFLNGHGGNIIPGRQAVFELRQQYRQRTDLLLLFSCYWDLAKPHEQREGYVQREMGHACEWETSMMLRIAPQLVAADVSTLATVPFGDGFSPGYRGWITNDRTPTGHIGSPEHATAEKGEHLFTSFATGLAAFLKQITAWDGKPWS